MENTFEKLTKFIDRDCLERGVYAVVVGWIVVGYALALLTLL